MNLLTKIQGDEPEPRQPDNKIELEAPKSEENNSIKVKDYTFGAKLRQQNVRKEKLIQNKKENILYNSLQKKFEPYMNSSELGKFSITAFSISAPLTETKSNGNSEDQVQTKGMIDLIEDNQEPISEQKKDEESSINKFYKKVVSSKGKGSLNNLKIYLDHEVESLLVNMESHYSTQLTDLLFNHFHLMEYLRLFRCVFFLEKEYVYDNFIREALLTVCLIDYKTTLSNFRLRALCLKAIKSG